MRISDWSSDVCSSDLLGRRAAANEPCAVFTAIGLSRHDAGLEKFARRRRRHFLHRHAALGGKIGIKRSEEHTSELQSLMRISYAVFCLKKKKTNTEY